MAGGGVWENGTRYLTLLNRSTRLGPAALIRFTLRDGFARVSAGSVESERQGFWERRLARMRASWERCLLGTAGIDAWPRVGQREKALPGRPGSFHAASGRTRRMCRG